MDVWRIQVSGITNEKIQKHKLYITLYEAKKQKVTAALIFFQKHKSP